LKPAAFIDLFRQNENSSVIFKELESTTLSRIHLKGLIGSSRALILAGIFQDTRNIHVVVLPDKEIAAYFFNDLESLFDEREIVYEKKKILFFPTSYKRHYELDSQDSTRLLARSEVLNRIGTTQRETIVVTYSEALSEKVVTQKFLSKNTLKLRKGEEVGLDFIADTLNEYGFERVDFVFEPGQFSIRGGIVDVFSYSNDHPYRIEFLGEEVESIRTFDPGTQLSVDQLSYITLLPNVQDRHIVESRESFLSFLPSSSVIWADNLKFSADRIDQELEKARSVYEEAVAEESGPSPLSVFISGNELLDQADDYNLIEFGRQFYMAPTRSLVYNLQPQSSFNKNFDLLIDKLEENTKDHLYNYIFSDNPKQIERLYAIFEDIQENRRKSNAFDFTSMNIALHEGFIDKDLGIACYTDHQIFERYHKFHLKDSYNAKEAITLKEIYNLNPGDYVTHIDHGVGQFAGLEKIDNNGKQQEAIRLVYKNGDLLYVSIHSLHRIAKFIGKDGTPPKLDKLGSGAWNKLKTRTKKKVKDIARELIKLYAERKRSKGMQYSPDTYLQNELEASFIYEDTPDQLKATIDVKKDLEASYPMDRLVCGDVGFGKTEIAIRAAFKVVAESKQVAILVPTTILALQHYKTFSERLDDFPCRVDYINRFKTQKEQKQTIKDLKDGRIDILIGTHRLISKDIEFKDLGLLIIDEEQKFGVSNKEKLKQIKVNVDTLVLTATPIPRTLQFSLMGARDLSIINTPPPNRYPIQTEIRSFGEEIIRDSILYELSRGGQVYFVHNRVQNINDVELMIRKFVPNVSIAVAHGQMEGSKLEKIMLEFINGQYDILLATTIIESGLDIPNVNTIIINDAQNYGLSDLHQLRGRVGRSNKKAFCYLLAPPLSVLTQDARKRLKAIEEFADLGSGFNIAMRDLDIRGAGNILGAEQSGFISDIGFEMYQKILDEALQELKESDFKDVYDKEEIREYVRDCQIESDLEILIPDDYISNITERLSLYKELDNISEEVELQQFRLRLIDRFGPVPDETEQLIETIRLRWMARVIGFEKLFLKNERLSGFFVANQESPYYSSEVFSTVITYVQQHPSQCRLKERNNKLSLIFSNVKNVSQAIKTLRPLREKIVSSE